ncbi:MAG: smalltalk protein [Bacteroidaceae bacterium]|nr:smalltalk protein [Bacteroidaceae bacterium]
MKNRELWKYVIQLAVAILTAIGTTLGVTSCMSMI